MHFSRFLPCPLINTIFLNNTNQSEIINIVQTFKPKTSTGHDGLSMKLLKQIMYYIASPLEYIFNLSLQNGKCLNMLQIAKVIYQYIRKTTKTQINNYRPLSVLPTISKILEKVVYKRLISFLTILITSLIFLNLGLDRILQLTLQSYSY